LVGQCASSAGHTHLLQTPISPLYLFRRLPHMWYESMWYSILVANAAQLPCILQAMAHGNRGNTGKVLGLSSQPMVCMV
jgi:hypothetical protein